MPRRQRFKPSRKPKPAIEPSESEIIQPTRAPEQAASQDQQAVEEREERIPR